MRAGSENPRAFSDADRSVQRSTSRVANWDIQIVNTIADDALADLLVIGHEVRKLNQMDIVGANMTMMRRNEQLSTGKGRACIDSPLSSARLGRPLRRGDLVLSGALGSLSAAAPGDLFEAQIDCIGSVRIEFGGLA
jgi:2-keto-4-pentenoate hydratase